MPLSLVRSQIVFASRPRAVSSAFTFVMSSSTASMDSQSRWSGQPSPYGPSPWERMAEGLSETSASSYPADGVPPEHVRRVRGRSLLDAVDPPADVVVAARVDREVVPARRRLVDEGHRVVHVLPGQQRVVAGVL